MSGLDQLRRPLLGPQNQATHHLLGQLHVFLDARDPTAVGLEVRQDVRPALFSFDVVRELALTPFADGDDFGIRSFEDVVDHGQRPVPIGGRQSRIHQKHPFV